MSPTTDNLGGLVNLITGALPSILALIRENRAAANPAAPPLTDAEVIAGLHAAVSSVVAKGDNWKAAHPLNGGNSTGE